MKAAIRYFTGTGNTARAAALAEKEFVSAGWTAELREIRSGMALPYAGIEDADLLVLAFPVLGFSPPHTVCRWTTGLPRKKKQRAAVLAVGGALVLKDRYIPGWGADAPFSQARALRRRGREIIGIGELSYPDNFTQATEAPDEAGCRAIRAKNDPAAKDFVRGLIAAFGDPARNPVMVRSLPVRIVFSAIALIFRRFGRICLSKTYIADSSCTGCGLCARVCPARAIRLRRGRPRWNRRCADCNRCINICPSGSINTSTALLVLQLALSVLLTAFALSVALPRDLPLFARGGIRFAILIGLCALQVGPFSIMLGALSRLPLLRPFFEAAFNKKFRRYRDPDFDPENHRGA